MTLTVDRNKPVSNAISRVSCFHLNTHSSSFVTPSILTNSVSKTTRPHQHPHPPPTQPDPNELTKRAPRRNGPHGPLPVPKLRRDRQRPLVADAHVQQSLVPPLDDLPLADGKVQRLAPVVAGVELGAVGGEGAAVVDGDAVPALGLARAFVGDGVVGCDFGAEGEGEEEG